MKNTNPHPNHTLDSSADNNADKLTQTPAGAQGHADADNGINLATKREVNNDYSELLLIPPPVVPVPDHLPPSMMASVKLLPEHQSLMLFTRHSLRERSDGQGFASYQLPLTPKGRVLAKAWGRWLGNNLPYSMDALSLTSPIERCVNTAKLMQEGAGIKQDIAHQPLLVEPGSLVTEPKLASETFKKIGALEFINRFLMGNIAGTKDANQGGLDILHLFYEHQPKKGHLSLAVSHDTLLAAFLGVMMDSIQIDWNDWPKMMEGVFLWFDDKPFNESTLNFIWRGSVYHKPVRELLT